MISKLNVPADFLVEKIEENRTSALSSVEKLLKSQIMSHQANYAKALADHQRTSKIAARTGDTASLLFSEYKILESSLAFGYLALERRDGSGITVEVLML